MSEIDDTLVYQGLWTDWSEGTVMGRKITTDIRTGTVVVSLLAILASLATTHLWHIVTFLLHQIRAKGEASDGLFWQQQAILRTLPTPSALMADNLNLWWNWKGRTNSTLLRCLFQILVAALFVSATLAATLATSFIVDTSDVRILVNSPACGMMNSSRSYEAQAESATNGYTSKTRLMSSLYTENCYNGTNTPSSCRNTFIKSRMSFESQAAECPFNKTMCVGGDMPAVTFDTGLLSMRDDLGLNLKASNDIKFRKKTTCAVVELKGRSQLVDQNNEELPFSLGLPTYRNGTTFPTFQAYLGGFYNYSGNATFSMELSQSRLIQSNGAFPNWPLRKGDWVPIPELVRTDADTLLALIALDNLWFSTPVEDPLLAAHREVQSTQLRSGKNFTAYAPDNPAGMLGCIEQYQYCHSDGSKQDFCTSLQAQPYIFKKEDFPNTNTIQLAALQLLLAYQQELTMALAVIHPMRINSLVILQESAPANQWVLEAANWLNYQLAALQLKFTDYAIGPTVRDATVEQFVDKPTTEGQKELCKIQMMRKSGGFANINYFGLIFILTVSITLITLDITLLKIFVFMSRFRRALAPRLDRWIQDGVLQLQRRAYEAQGYVKWEQVDQEVPVTGKDTKLKELSQNKSFLLKREVTWEWNAGSRQVGTGMVRATLATVADSRDERTRWSTG